MPTHSDWPTERFLDCALWVASPPHWQDHQDLIFLQVHLRLTLPPRHRDDIIYIITPLYFFHSPLHFPFVLLLFAGDLAIAIIGIYTLTTVLVLLSQDLPSPFVIVIFARIHVPKRNSVYMVHD